MVQNTYVGNKLCFLQSLVNCNLIIMQFRNTTGTHLWKLLFFSKIFSLQIMTFKKNIPLSLLFRKFKKELLMSSLFYFPQRYIFLPNRMFNYYLWKTYIRKLMSSMKYYTCLPLHLNKILLGDNSLTFYYRRWQISNHPIIQKMIFFSLVFLVRREFFFHIYKLIFISTYVWNYAVAFFMHLTIKIIF